MKENTRQKDDEEQVQILSAFPYKHTYQNVAALCQLGLARERMQVVHV